MYPTDRRTHRQIFIHAWHKAAGGQPLEPIEAQIVEILRQHPEYLPLIEAEDDALDRDFSPEQGEQNPFLHLGLHLAIQEQVGIDQPVGIRQLYLDLAQRSGDAHQTEHRIMECLVDALWRLQRNQGSFSEQDYLDCIRGSGPKRG